MTSASKFSSELRGEILKLRNLSRDSEIYELLDLLSAEPFQEKSFMEILNKVLNDYDMLYENTHPKKPQDSLLPIITNDARYPKLAEDVDKAYKVLQQIIQAIKKSSVNDTYFISCLKTLVEHTNSIKNTKDLKDRVLLTGKRPQRRSNFLKRLLTTVGIMFTVGTGTISSIHNENSPMNKPITELIKPEVINRSEAEGISIGEAIRRIEAEKIAKVEKDKKDAEEKAKKFQIEYKQVMIDRKDVIAKVDTILSRLKIPIAYLTPMDIKSLIWQESRFDPNIVSHAGAYGLMQVTEKSCPKSISWEECKTNIEKNMKAGFSILKEKEDFCKGYYGTEWFTFSAEKKREILYAIYNSGEGAWEAHGGELTAMRPETQTQVETTTYFLKQTRNIQ
jgi:hypothetical protein